MIDKYQMPFKIPPSPGSSCHPALDLFLFCFFSHNCLIISRACDVLNVVGATLPAEAAHIQGKKIPFLTHPILDDKVSCRALHII